MFQTSFTPTTRTFFNYQDFMFRSTYSLCYLTVAQFRFLISSQDLTIAALSKILVHAAMQGHMAILREFYCKSKFGHLLDCFLYYGVTRNHVNVVAFVLQKGAHIQVRSQALEIAVRNQQLDIFRLLIRTKIHRKAKQNALHDAVTIGHVAMIQDLLLHGAKY